MTPATTGYEHIVLDERRVPIIAGTTMKVVELVEERMAHGWSPEELHFQHPYLSLGQIHSALAYYFDHQAELDADIEERLARGERLETELKKPEFVRQLKSRRRT